MKYTYEQLERVLAKSAGMKAAIDNLEEIAREGLVDFIEFGKAINTCYAARDAYMREQHEIVAENLE